MSWQPGSVLFCCDHNAVRSPMAEGIMKKLCGHAIYVQSAGVHHDLEINGFAISVCEEIGVNLTAHRSRSFSEMEEWGDDITQFELVVAMTPAAQRLALEYTRFASLEIEFWPIMDPTGFGEKREEKLEAFRGARDQIYQRIKDRFECANEPEGD